MLKLCQIAAATASIYKYTFESGVHLNNPSLSAAKASTEIALKARGIVTLVLRVTHSVKTGEPCVPSQLSKPFHFVQG